MAGLAFSGLRNGKRCSSRIADAGSDGKGGSVWQVPNEAPRWHCWKATECSSWLRCRRDHPLARIHGLQTEQTNRDVVTLRHVSPSPCEDSRSSDLACAVGGLLCGDRGISIPLQGFTVFRPIARAIIEQAYPESPSPLRGFTAFGPCLHAVNFVPNECKTECRCRAVPYHTDSTHRKRAICLLSSRLMRRPPPKQPKSAQKTRGLRSSSAIYRQYDSRTALSVSPYAAAKLLFNG